MARKPQVVQEPQAPAPKEERLDQPTPSTSAQNVPNFIYNLQRLLFTEVVWPASQVAKKVQEFRIPTASIEDKLPYYEGEGKHKALPDIRLRSLDRSVEKNKMTLQQLKATDHQRDDHKLPLDFHIGAFAGATFVNIAFLATLITIRP